MQRLPFLLGVAIAVVAAVSPVPKFGFESALESGPGVPAPSRWRESTRAGTSDTTQIDSAAIGSRLTPAQVRILIERHNQARAEVRVGRLKWSKQLAIYAQAWADHLASGPCQLEHRPHSGKWRQKHGENLFMGTSGYYDVGDAVESWVSEKKSYDGRAVNAANSQAVGHYTQVVWKHTRQFGCATAECDGYTIVVCNYDPPGNILGQKPY